MIKSDYSNRGFVALISAVIIAALLVGLCFSVSSSEFTARIGILNSGLHKTSVYLADSCADTALYDISQNFSYAVPLTGQIMAVGNNSCTIASIVYGQENMVTHQKIVTVQTSAEYRGVGAHEEIVANVQDPNFVKSNIETRDITIVSWTENE
jgi:hypothetical protein